MVAAEGSLVGALFRQPGCTDMPGFRLCGDMRCSTGHCASGLVWPCLMAQCCSEMSDGNRRTILKQITWQRMAVANMAHHKLL